MMQRHLITANVHEYTIFCLSTPINLPHCLRCPLLCIHALSGACTDQWMRQL